MKCRIHIRGSSYEVQQQDNRFEITLQAAGAHFCREPRELFAVVSLPAISPRYVNCWTYAILVSYGLADVSAELAGTSLNSFRTTVRSTSQLEHITGAFDEGKPPTLEIAFS
jgi:hypothetical protein